MRALVSAESGFGHEPFAKLPDVSDMAQCLTHDQGPYDFGSS